MNDINITLGYGGLGRDSINYDVISGLALFTTLELQADFDTALITDLSATNRIKKYNSLEEFEKLTNITFNNSLTEEIWYQVKEFFRLKPNTTLYIGLFFNTNLAGTPLALTYTELKDMQIYANGDIRQIGVVTGNTAFGVAEIEKIQGIADELFTLHMPLSFVYGGDTSALALSSLSDVKNLSTPSKNVSAVILQDGDNYGATLYATAGYSIPAVGATLGAVSKANVNESIAWVKNFNLSGAGELDNPAFGNGVLVKDTLQATLNDINTKGYLFGIKHVGIAGTYFNDNYTCDVATSDYSYMGEVRTIDKAVREVRTTMLPYLNSPIKVDSKTGYIDSTSIALWTNFINTTLDKMAKNAEISAYKVYIDPKQEILVTSTLEIVITLIPYGTARNINITIGYSVTL